MVLQGFQPEPPVPIINLALNWEEQLRGIPLPSSANSNSLTEPGISEPELEPCQVSFTLAHLPGKPNISIPTHMFSSANDFIYLDKGAFGEVFKFTEPVSGNSVALKAIRFGKDAEAAKNDIQKEIELHKKLLNPHIVHYIGSHEADGVIFIVMEFMENGSLAKKLYNVHQSSSFSIPALPSITILKYVHQILQGLLYLHDGDQDVKNKIIHRDLRAANVLLDSHDDAKIADFGISKQLDTISSKSQFHTNVGNIYWQAPEMIRGDVDVIGRRVDIWSLGITILEMIFVRPTFVQDHDNISYMRLHLQGQERFKPELVKIIDQIADTNLKDLLEKCLVYNAENRPTSSQLLENFPPF